MTLQSLIPFGKVRWTSQSMNTKLFVPMALIGVCLVGITPASAAFIEFRENPDDTSNIAVNTDIDGARLTLGSELAIVGLGDVLPPAVPIVFLRRNMIEAGVPGEDGVNGVSDVLQVISFVDAANVVVGFMASFSGDISPPPINFPPGVTDLPENGDLQLLTPAGFTITLPGGGGPVGLAVSAQSDVQFVPSPIVGAGLPGLILACGVLLALARRRRQLVA